ncbi:MAG: ketol-acid reductoisomerase [Actinomycetes bacterium]|jgi:ketol-acid reductoisomerase|nr:ketol-acid reductoisomerase [Actinomycetes bacterium]
MRRFTENEIDPQLIRDTRVAMLGYGSQGRAQALNLRDSGVRAITIGVRNPDSASARQATDDGFPVATLAQAAAASDLLMFMLPDEAQAGVYTEIAAACDLAGKTLGFAHGYAIRFNLIEPPADTDVILIAPKGVGPAVRARYAAGSGVAGLVATEQDRRGDALPLALSYAAAIGCARVAIFQTTFAEECEADLFSEQAVIVGGLTQLLRAGFDTLVDAGYAPEVAWFECVAEAKLILDLIVADGFSGMFAKISNTAEFGAMQAGESVINSDTRRRMQGILESVRNGDFARTWAEQVASGMTEMRRVRAAWDTQPIQTMSKEMGRLWNKG